MSYLSMTRGDDRELTITASEDLTGADIVFSAKRSRRDPDTDAVIRVETPDITIDGDEATVPIAAADTDDITDVPLALYWDVQIIAGSKTRTVATGRLSIQPDVTRAT